MAVEFWKWNMTRWSDASHRDKLELTFCYFKTIWISTYAVCKWFVSMLQILHKVPRQKSGNNSELIEIAKTYIQLTNRPIVAFAILLFCASAARSNNNKSSVTKSTPIDRYLAHDGGCFICIVQNTSDKITIVIIANITRINVWNNIFFTSLSNLPMFWYLNTEEA